MSYFVHNKSKAFWALGKMIFELLRDIDLHKKWEKMNLFWHLRILNLQIQFRSESSESLSFCHFFTCVYDFLFIYQLNRILYIDSLYLGNSNQLTEIIFFFFQKNRLFGYFQTSATLFPLQFCSKMNTFKVLRTKSKKRVFKFFYTFSSIIIFYNFLRDMIAFIIMYVQIQNGVALVYNPNTFIIFTHFIVY